VICGADDTVAMDFVLALLLSGSGFMTGTVPTSHWPAIEQDSALFTTGGLEASQLLLIHKSHTISKKGVRYVRNIRFYAARRWVWVQTTAIFEVNV